MKIGVFGLGSMGHGIAMSLLRGGHEVCGEDIDIARVNLFRDEGGLGRNMTEVIPELDAVVLVVLNQAQTEDVLFGAEGVAARLRKGAVVVCSVTVAPDFARRMGKLCAEMGLLYLDAPISGGAAKAAEGRLSIMASGSQDAFQMAAPILDAISETLFDLGPNPGAGSAMKAVNQMLAGVHIAAMAEAITFGMTQGIDPRAFIEVIPKCAGTSWMLENRAPHVASGDYAPRSAVGIWPKDLGIVMEIASKANFSAPVTEAALRQFATAADMGLAREDDAAVAKVYARRSGLTLPGEN